MVWHGKSQTVRWLAMALAIGLWATGCSSAEQKTCERRTECDSGEVCIGGFCGSPAEDGSCTSNEECVPGEECVGRLCVMPSPEPDPNPMPNPDPNPGPQPTPDPNPVPNPEPDPPEDREPPQIVRRSPDSGNTGVSENAEIIVEFSEPIRDFGLEQKILLNNADTLEPVEAVAQLDGSVVTLQPVQPLSTETPYIVVVTNQISDLAGNRLPDDFRWFFSTRIQPEPEHAEIAQRFAPVVFQEVDRTSAIGRADRFSAINLDGDFIADNNLLTYQETDQVAEAYYHIIETETHVFVQYLFYYPANYNDTLDNFHEHDVSATQVVLERGDGGALDFVMAEGAYGSQSFGFAVEGKGVEDRNLGDLALTFPASDLVDGTRYLAYHGQHFHGSCHWDWSPGGIDIATAPWCSHSEGEFLNDTNSVVYYPGMTGQGRAALSCGADADCAPAQGITCQEGACRDGDGLRAQTYALRDFREDLWIRRINISGTDRLFNGRADYDPHPDSGDRPGAGEDNRKFPATFDSADSRSRGELPFIWESPGSVAPGQWWVDPAYTFSTRFSFGEAAFSQDYCYNPYFEIDRRGTENCP